MAPESGTLKDVSGCGSSRLKMALPLSSKIRAVYAFVRDCLRDDVKPIKFILCACVLPLLKNPTNPLPCMHASLQPPPRDLKVSDPDVRDLTLTELRLALSSLPLQFVDNALNRAFFLPAPSLRVRSGLMVVRRFGRACPVHICGPGTRCRTPHASQLCRRSEKV